MTSQIRSEPVWQGPALEFPGAPPTSPVDVCVVGAGIAGMSVAYALTRRGLRPLVLDDGPVGGGQTAVTTAHLASALDDRFARLARLRGAEAARGAYEAHAAAIDFIEGVCGREAIDCDFRRVDGYLFAPDAVGSSGADLIAEEKVAARAAGADVEWLAAAPLPGRVTGPCLRFARQGSFHPLRYLAGLADAIRRADGQILTGVHVRAVVGGRHPRALLADGQEVRCRAVVVATNSPINDTFALHTKQAPYITSVVALEAPLDLHPGADPDALYWDTEDPYHYVRRAAGPDGTDLLLVGGEDHKTGQAKNHEERFARLEAWARRHFPGAGPVRNHWAGQVLETLDGLAHIGANPGDENVYVVTGDSGMGLTHGTIAGLLLPDLIQGLDHPWAALFDPAHKPLAAIATFLGENLSAASTYLDWLTPGDLSSADAIPPGGGAVLRDGLTKLAVHRTEAGELHACAATCPHLGGVVRWNDSEKMWECPLHGSRFLATGEVVNGPANVDLAPAAVPAEVG